MQQADLMEKFEALGKSLECRTNCAEIDVSRIVFDAGLRKSCEMNSCGAYGRNYMCPPFCGEIHELIDKAKSYQKAFVFQSIHAPVSYTHLGSLYLFLKTPFNCVTFQSKLLSVLIIFFLSIPL